MNKKIYYVLLIFILLIAIMVRVIGWPNAIEEINIDEAMTAINAKSLLESGTDIYGTSYPVYLNAWPGQSGQSVMLLYLMVITIKIFGFSLFSIRLPMLIISIISLFIIYDLMRRISNKKVALIVLAFLAINPWHIMQSRWAIDCNMFPHFFLIGVYFLYIGIEKKYYLYLSMLFFGLSLYTYGVAMYFVPIFLLITAIYLVKAKKVKIKQLLLCILIFLLIITPIILLAIINVFDLPNITLGKITIQNLESASRLDEQLIFSNNKLDSLSKNITDIFNTLFIQYDYNWNSIKNIGTIYKFSIIFLIIGIVFAIKKKVVEKEKVGINIILFWFITSIILGLIIKTNINKLNIIWYPIVILTGLGIYNTIKYSKKKSIIAIIILLLYTASFIHFNIIYFKEWTNVIERSNCWSNGFIDVLQYVDNNKTENDEILIIKSKVFDSNSRINTYVKYALGLEHTYQEFNVQYDVKDLEKYNIIIVRKNKVETIKELNIEKYDNKEFKEFLVLERINSK